MFEDERRDEPALDDPDRGNMPIRDPDFARRAREHEDETSDETSERAPDADPDDA